MPLLRLHHLLHLGPSGRQQFERAAERFDWVRGLPECPPVPRKVREAYRAGLMTADDRELRRHARTLRRHTDELHGAVMAVW